MSDEIILKTENLTVEFDGNKILNDLNFEVKKGDIMAVIGPNGAGKTVLFRALLGIIPFKGKILWSNNVKIGYVPQKFTIGQDGGSLPLTVGEFMKYKGKREEFIRSLELVGFKTNDGHHFIHHLLLKQISTLSGGEIQKILIAWAITENPNVLLFDEPTSGIDIGGEETIYGLIRKLNRQMGITVIFISHDLHVIYKYATGVLCLNKEKLCFGPPHEALDRESLAKLYGTEVNLYQHFEHKH